MSTIDRSNLVCDPRDNGPFYGEWVDKATGLNCIVLKTASGAWCGYVEIPASVASDIIDESICEGASCAWLSPTNGIRRIGFIARQGDHTGGAPQTMVYIKGECEKVAQRLCELSKPTS